MPLDTSPDESRGISNFVKEFSSKDEGLFQKALDVFKKVLSSFNRLILPFNALFLRLLHRIYSPY